MPFGVISRLGPRMGQVVGVGDCPREGAILGVDMGRPLVTVRTLWRNCAKVREAIEMPFGMLSGVSLGICALDGCPHLPKVKSLFGDFQPLLISSNFPQTSCHDIYGQYSPTIFGRTN